MVFAVILIVAGVFFFVGAFTIARDGEPLTAAAAFLFGFTLLTSGVLQTREAREHEVSGTYATTKSVSDGTYMVRGQFEDPLGRKVLLIQGADGKIRALVLRIFVPVETKVVEIDGNWPEPKPQKDPS